MISHIYIIYSNSIDKYYIGYSSNPWHRINQHNSNLKDKYTGRAQDWVIKSVFEVENESVAIKIERFIKKQKSRNLIERLCQKDFFGENILAQLVRVPHMRD
ncbi:MAG: hypothetical protein RIS20_1871 [Bacteroidota bacterium]|jgi:putative endonuclease